ncbi:MAG: hypothetical protein VB835_10380 [Pirellulales bacterium]
MSGPIVRSGPSPEFTKNWEQAFAKKKAKKKTAKAAGTKSKAKKKTKKKS